MTGLGGRYRPVPPRARPPGPAWSMVAPVVGLLSLLAVFVRFPGGLAGIAGGVAGIGTGVVGVIAARRAAARTVPASSGVTLSALAIGVGVALVLIHPTPAGGVAGGGSADDTTDAVLRHELEVTVGEFGGVKPKSKRGRLPVTFRNKTGRTAEFEVAVAAFDAGGTQVDSAVAHVLLAGRSTEDQEMFRFGPAARLATASFRILSAHRIPRGNG